VTHAATSAEVIERHHTATAYVVLQDRTLLLWHDKLHMWLPPGGHCELNEDPVQAALREALEETGIRTVIIPPIDLLVCAGPAVLPPPAVILIEDIVRHDQPFHQHIDHVYFTRPVEPVDLAARIPGGHPLRWVTGGELAVAFSLEAPDGTLVPVAEDVRLLGMRAIAAEGAQTPAHA
jgi:8-oxo-dGTP pyrophosphatase MutT (NUDIX family)